MHFAHCVPGDLRGSGIGVEGARTRAIVHRQMEEELSALHEAVSGRCGLKAARLDDLVLAMPRWVLSGRAAQGGRMSRVARGALFHFPC